MQYPGYPAKSKEAKEVPITAVFMCSSQIATPLETDPPLELLGCEVQLEFRLLPLQSVYFRRREPMITRVSVSTPSLDMIDYI
jgi:hypothetical protein